jgi:LysM repeat protein
MKKKRFFLLLSLFTILLTPLSSVHSAQQSGADLITLINTARAGKGLPPLSQDVSLNNAAQDQADYLAGVYGPELTSVVDWHTQPDGGDVYNRALRAGYAFGPGWYVDEIAYGGKESSTPRDALSAWLRSPAQADAIHNAENVHIGAAISTGDGFAYYIVIFGIKLDSGGSSKGGVASTIPSTAVTPEVAPVSVATPNADGSVFHTVESGEALWSIAIAYDITIDQILALNNLEANAIIYDGQPLQVRSAFTPTPKPTETNTPVAPTRTPIPAQTAQAVKTLIPTVTVEDDGFLGMDNQTMGLALILISGIGLVMIVVGNLAKDKAARGGKKE